MTFFFSEGNIQHRGKVGYREGFVNLPGRRLRYLDYGGTGEIVVALHGYVQNAHAFDGIASVLVPHVHLLALDMRGRGGSDWGPPDSYRMHHYLRDLRDFLESLRLSRFSLIGTSMGGRLALLYSIAHPLEVTRLVLNDISLEVNRAAAGLAGRRYGRAPAKFASLSDALEWFLETRDDLGSLDGEARLAWVRHFLTPEETAGYRFNCDPVLFHLARLIPAIPRQKERSRRQLVMDQAKRLKMPVLLLRGANSEVVPRHSARLMMKHLPTARWIEVPGAGHAPTLYEPAAQIGVREFFGTAA